MFGNCPSQPKQAVQHLHLVRKTPLERWQGVEAHADRGDDDEGDREERDDLGGHRGVRLLKQVPQTSEDNIYALESKKVQVRKLDNTAFDL